MKNVCLLLLPLLLAAIVASTAAAAVGPVELVTNGGFETGDLTGWTIADAGNGFFAVTNTNNPPGGGPATVGPSSGAFYAVSGQGGPGTHALIQTFTVPGPASSVILSYDMFVQTFAPQTVDPIGLDHTGPPNQHARADVLSSTAPAFDTVAGVLANYYLGIDGVPPQNYTPYLFDITSVVGGGGTFQLRFAQTDNRGFFSQGVDNVSIEFTAIPEPSTLALLALGACGMPRRRYARRG